MQCPSIARTTGFSLSAREQSRQLKCCRLWLLLSLSLDASSPASRACADSVGGTHSVVTSDDDWSQALSPLRIPFSFPANFTGLPATRVWLDSERTDDRLRITSLTTNGFEVEIPAYPMPLPARPARAEEEFADETVVGFIGGQPALVELKSDGALFVHHADGLSESEELKTERVNLLPLSLAEGVPWAATLADDRLVLLWTGPTGLCISRAAGPFGDPPWTTEVITAALPEFTAANVAEVGERLAVSLVLRDPTDAAQDRVRVTLWTEELSGGRSWIQRFQHPITLPLLEQKTHYKLATRVGQLDGHILVSVGNVSISSRFLGCLQDACLYEYKSTGGTVWLTADSNQNQPKVESAPTSPWTQVLNRNRRTFVVTRAVNPNMFGTPKLGRPELQAFPQTFHWEAADRPRIRIQGEQVLGFGVPKLPDGSTRSYRVLRTAALAPTGWEPVGTVTPGENGSFGILTTTVGEQAFYRVDEQP